MIWKNRFLFVAALALLISMSVCTPPPEYAPAPILPDEPTGLKRILSVLDFENFSGHGGAEIGSGFSDRLVSALMAHDVFVLLERQRLPDLLGEAELGQSGAVTLESAVRVGKVMGAQAVITASISDFDLDVMEQDLGNLFDFELAWQLFRAQVTINYRIVDVSTGKIIAGKRVSIQRTKPAVGFEIDEYAFSNLEEIDNTLLGTLSSEVVSTMAGEIIRQHSKIPWYGKVVDIRENTVYFTPGKNCGITTGMPFEIHPPAGEKRRPVLITVSGFVGEHVAKAELPLGAVSAIGDRVVEFSGTNSVKPVSGW